MTWRILQQGMNKWFLYSSVMQSNAHCKRFAEEDSIWCLFLLPPAVDKILVMRSLHAKHIITDRSRSHRVRVYERWPVQCVLEDKAHASNGGFGRNSGRRNRSSSGNLFIALDIYLSVCVCCFCYSVVIMCYDEIRVSLPDGKS